MGRSVVIVLLLANAFVWAWTRGWLDGVIGPARLDTPGEPQRLARQVHPEGVVVLPLRAASADRAAAAQAAARTATAMPSAASAAREAGAAFTDADTAPATSGAASGAAMQASASAGLVAAGGASAASAPPGPASAAMAAATAAVCLQGGPFTERETRALMRASLSFGVPEADWAQRAVAAREEWIVYIGPLRDRAALQAKLQELQRLGVSAREVAAAPDLQPGVVLARSPSAAAAETVREALVERGVRTARVVDLAAARPRWQLRLDAAPATLLAQLQTVNLPAAAADKRLLGVCRATPPANTARAASAPASAPPSAPASAAAAQTGR